MSENTQLEKVKTIEDYKESISYGILQISEKNIAAKTAALSQALSLPDIVRNALTREEPNLHKLVRMGSMKGVVDVCQAMLKRFISLNFSNSEENAAAIIYDFTNDLLIDHPDLTLPDIVFFFKHIRQQQGVNPEYRTPTNVLTPLQLSKWLNLYVMKRKQEEEELRNRKKDMLNKVRQLPQAGNTSEQDKQAAENYRKIIEMLAEKNKKKQQQKAFKPLTDAERENALFIAFNYDQLDAAHRKEVDEKVKKELAKKRTQKEIDEYNQRVRELELKHPLKKNREA